MTTLHKLTTADAKYCDNRDSNGGLLATFNSNLGDHQMAILHDEGLYRHLRFKNPELGLYWFELITWPGNLTITGDIGTYTFAREQDMFTFMVGHINTHYWAEKLKAGSSGGRSEVKNYDEGRFKKWLVQDFWEYSRDMDTTTTRRWWEHLKDEVLDDWVSTGTTESALQAVQNISDSNSPLRDHYDECWESVSAWEQYDWHFELCLAAIVAGIRTYKAHKAIDPIATA